MFRKSTVTMACLAVALSGGLYVSTAHADATGNQPSASEQSAQNWCAQKGGKAIDYSPWYHTNNPKPTPLGGSYSMCRFTNKDGTRIVVAADSLAADRPTQAALAYMLKPAVPPAPNGSNPSAWYCTKIGGTVQFGGGPADVGGWAPSSEKAPQDFEFMCVFADRSMIDTWGLAYHTNGVIRGADLTGKWKATMPKN